MGGAGEVGEESVRGLGGVWIGSGSSCGEVFGVNEMIGKPVELASKKVKDFWVTPEL